MALIQVNYLSKALFRTVTLNVILPADKLSFAEGRYAMKPGQKFPTLYLLHGLLGNYTDYVSNTRIQKWAEARNLAVVMPSGDNSFYINGLSANTDYETFIGEELPLVTRNMFPLSDRREDTFIGGLSMGGYGAIRNGLKYSRNFSRIAAMSPALVELDEGFISVAGENEVFGNIEEARKTDKNHFVALADLLERVRTDPKEKLPEVWLSCGLSDHLITSARLFRDELEKAGVALHYEEQPGGHEWDFWDSQLKKIIDWLPLDHADMGLGSGNVTKK